MRHPHRPTGIPPYVKVLATLHFYATGSYQLAAPQGYHFAMSQPSMSRCINETTNVIHEHFVPVWIVFLRINVERNKIKEVTTMTNRTRDTMVCYGPTGGAAGEWSGVGRGEVGGEVAHR
ncbi:hypothetical protein FQR65_LT13550 [Abscondita terminalis]|nr:hypothetical protein FQR65_LT13550 [Abscondita terminalis]